MLRFGIYFSIQHSDSALPVALFGDVANVGEFEPLALIGLEHQKQPQHGRERRNDDERQEPAERRDGGADEPQGAQPAKDQRRLQRVEPDEAILVFGEEKADAGDPPECIRQGGSDVLVESERGLVRFSSVLLQRVSRSDQLAAAESCATNMRRTSSCSSTQSV